MKMRKLQTLFPLVLWALLLSGANPQISSAASETNTTEDGVSLLLDPWTTEVHPNVVSFYRDEFGVYRGTTDDGQVFTQSPFYQDSMYRIERFEIGNHHHYIVNGVILYTLSSLPSPIRELEI